MSLLMDALKRAEKARQAEAAKQGAKPDASASQQFSIEQQEKSPRASAPSSPEPKPPSGSSPDTSSVMRLSLEDEDTPVPDHATTGSKTTGYHKPFSLLDDGAISPEDSGEMHSIAREAEEAVKKYFDDTDSEYPDSAEMAAADGNDSTAESHRKAASAVFDAKGPSRRRRGPSATIVAPVFLALVLGIGGFFLWDDFVRIFVGGPPSLLVRRPAPPGPVNVPAPVEETTRAGKMSPAAPESPPAGTVAGGGQASVDTTPNPASSEVGESAEVRKLMAAVEAASVDSGSSVPESTQLTASEPLRDDAPVATRESPPALPDKPVSEDSAASTERAPGDPAGAGQSLTAPSLRISRKPINDRRHETLQAAYEAFQQGDNAHARNLYARVLEQDARNRDALLGLGAIDTRTGNVDAARRIYARLLTLNPRDPVARAALIDSHRDVSPIEGEGHIKQLLAEYPDQPYLFITLGNLYSRQQRWPEAQQAYFDAYRLDQDNPDYAFNLAVSLDRLGQGATALSFYRRALDLAERGQANFEPQTVLKRISTLGTAVTK